MNEEAIQRAGDDIVRMRECFRGIQAQLSETLIGQQDALRLLLTGLMAGGHMLLVGVPGLAKTMMVKSLAESLGWDFRRIQFTPDLMPADITGTEILQSEEAGHRRTMTFHRGPVFANLILADEINRTPPKTQAALLEAMQEHAVTVSGRTYALPPPFVVVATQNPIEQEGTYPLPEAQLDRFLLSIHVGYPTREEEAIIAGLPLRGKGANVRPLAGREEFARFNDIIDAVPVSRRVLEAAVALTSSTRPKESGASEYVKRYVAWGAGPRATQHLVAAAKANAMLDGRPSPEVEDLKQVAVPVLRHRLVANYNAVGEGLDSGMIVRKLVEDAFKAG